MRRFYPQKFDIIAITVDMGFEGMDLSPIKDFCKELLRAVLQYGPVFGKALGGEVQ